MARIALHLGRIFPPDPEVVTTDVALAPHQHPLDLSAVFLVDQHDIRPSLESISVGADRLLDLDPGGLLGAVIVPQEVHVSLLNPLTLTSFALLVYQNVCSMSRRDMEIQRIPVAEIRDRRHGT